jgi:nitrate/nitrite transporter NarK
LIDILFIALSIVITSFSTPSISASSVSAIGVLAVRLALSVFSAGASRATKQIIFKEKKEMNKLIQWLKCNPKTICFIVSLVGALIMFGVTLYTDLHNEVGLSVGVVLIAVVAALGSSRVGFEKIKTAIERRQREAEERKKENGND